MVYVGYNRPIRLVSLCCNKRAWKFHSDVVWTKQITDERNYQVPFFFERRNDMAKKKEHDMGFWETLLAIFLIDWLF